MSIQPRFIMSHPADDEPSREECFDAHMGSPQTANLGDGKGWVNQTLELRNDYGNPDIGTCWESLAGGNHFRLWSQDGPKARSSNSLFLAYVNRRVSLFATDRAFMCLCLCE